MAKLTTALAHTAAIITILFAPPLLYDATQSYVGALAYPAYIAYWLFRIKSDQARFIALNAFFLLCTAAAVSTASCETFGHHPSLLISPLVVGLTPIAWLIPPQNGSRYPRRAFIISSIIGVVLGGVVTAFEVIAFSQCAMAGMRW